MKIQGEENLLDRTKIADSVPMDVHDQRPSSDFIGASSAFESIKQTISAIAARKCSIIISGETGTGKELVARQIHETSDRAENPFVPVDCTTLTGQLFESQLFGHKKGSFTGAIGDTLGFFRAAHQGTIFLDEISEIPLDLQAKLLRVLQESKVTPIGSTESHNIDIRVLCATNLNLKEMVSKGKFRADLYYRLNVVTLEVPPLRERKEDIMLLAEYFLRNQSALYDEPAKHLNDSAKKAILDYHWPGNIRELANAMERAYVLTHSCEITPAVLPSELIISQAFESDHQGHRIPTISSVKRKLIIQALEHTGGRKVAAAKILGIERRVLNRLLEKYNIKNKG